MIRESISATPVISTSNLPRIHRNDSQIVARPHGTLSDEAPAPERSRWNPHSNAANKRHHSGEHPCTRATAHGRPSGLLYFVWRGSGDRGRVALHVRRG